MLIIFLLASDRGLYVSSKIDRYESCKIGSEKLVAIVPAVLVTGLLNTPANQCNA